jgi:hypothetical protein
MKGLKASLLVLTVALLTPVAAWAQAGASVTGTVKDTSGAVLPGVTVEAASPVLIQKVRTGVTDANGVYRITELLPGTYTVTFTLQGFRSAKREGLQMSGSFAATLNVELGVGDLAETITVSGEAPTVDLQNTTRQTVVNSEVMAALPTGRNMFNLGVLIPGVTMTTGGLANQDVGGALGPNTLALGIHGGQTQDQRLTMNGVSLSTMIGGGWGGGTIPNTAGISEILFDTSAVDASLSTGGVRINFISKEGGNRYSGTLFGNFANSGLQGSNYTARVRGLGLSTPGDIVKNWEFNPGFGGPIKQDKLWFFLSGQSRGAFRLIPGQSYNLNANNLNAWSYAPDASRPAVENRSWEDYNARLTWQASPKNKIGFLYNIQSNCFCPFGSGFVTAPEAGNDQRFPLQRPILLDWTSPVSSKVLLEATAIHRFERWGAYTHRGENDRVDPRAISVVDNGPGAYRPGMTYRSAAQYSNNVNTTFHYKASVSYITGAHAFKVGFNDAWGTSDAGTTIEQPYAYTFFTPVGGRPTPASVTLRAAPYTISTDISHDTGFFVQDKWTRNRMTAALGVRFDHAASIYPETVLGPTILTPDRNLRFAEAKSFSWSDVTPKLGFAYDVFGTGKTAFKVSLNKYLRGVGTSFSQVPDANPVSAAIGNGQATRTWADANGNYIPDCDLSTRTPGANGECGALSDPLFGANNSAAVLNQLTWDEDARTGWNKRGFNWEFSTGIQHEILPRVSLDVGFFRRWYGNFQVVDNLALAASDFNVFSLTAPADSRLPGGGNYAVSGFANIKPTLPGGGFGVVNQNKITLAKKYGTQTEHFNGVDVNVNGRMENGLFFQGGTSTGRTSFNNCDVMNALPEVQFESLNFFSPNFFSTLPRQFCNRGGVLLTQVKGFVAYTIPKAEVQISTTVQSLPGVPIEARLNAPFNPNVGGLAALPFASNFHVLEPGQEYGERVNQIDMRVAKLLRFGGTRTMISLDFYNLLNVDTITAQNNVFTPGATFPWQQATSILTARFIKIGAQFDW